MNSSVTDKSEIIPAQNAEVLGLLNQILSMPVPQRQALGKAWAAMDPFYGVELARQGFMPEEDVAQGGFVDQIEVGKLNSWMAQLHPLPPRERIAKLQYALDQEGEEWAVTLLKAEISKVKNSQPWLAAEIAAVKYAYEHPFLMTVALFGLGLGAYRFGKSLLAVIF